MPKSSDKHISCQPVSYLYYDIFMPRLVKSTRNRLNRKGLAKKPLANYLYTDKLESPVLLWHIGDVVRKMREAFVDEATGVCGLTQGDLAIRAGIRPNTLSDLERNVSNYSRETLGKIAIALNVTIEGLYAQIPGVTVPTTTDPADAETIARYLKLEGGHRKLVGQMVDTLGHFPERTGQADADDQSTPRSGT